MYLPSPVSSVRRRVSEKEAQLRLPSQTAVASTETTRVMATKAGASMPPAGASIDGDAHTLLSGHDASRMCLSVRARLVDERGRAGAEAVARVGGTLLVAESKHLGRGFDADDIGAWCASTAESKGRGVGPVRRAVPIRREEGWKVEMRKVRVRNGGPFFRRGAEESAWRVTLVGDVAADGKEEDGKKGKKERLELDFGERKDEAVAWFETLRGAVTPWSKLFGIAEDEVKHGVDVIEEELEESDEVSAVDDGERGEGEGQSRLPGKEEVSPNENEDDDGMDELDPEAEGDANLPGEGKTAVGPLAGLEDRFKGLVANPAVQKITSNPFAKKAVGFLVKKKVMRKLPLPKTTPQLFVAKQVMSHVYKRRFSLKTALMRTPMERSYACLHTTRSQYLFEICDEVAKRGENIGKLATSIDALEEQWRECDKFVVGGHGMAGIIGKPAAVFTETEKLAEELSKAEFIVAGKWENAKVESVDQLVGSFGSDLTV